MRSLVIPLNQPTNPLSEEILQDLTFYQELADQTLVFLARSPEDLALYHLFQSLPNPPQTEVIACGFTPPITTPKTILPKLSGKDYTQIYQQTLFNCDSITILWDGLSNFEQANTVFQLLGNLAFLKFDASSESIHDFTPTVRPVYFLTPRLLTPPYHNILLKHAVVKDPTFRFNPIGRYDQDYDRTVQQYFQKANLLLNKDAKNQHGRVDITATQTTFSFPYAYTQPEYEPTLSNDDLNLIENIKKAQKGGSTKSTLRPDETQMDYLLNLFNLPENPFAPMNPLPPEEDFDNPLN